MSFSYSTMPAVKAYVVQTSKIIIMGSFKSHHKKQRGFVNICPLNVLKILSERQI